jgi:hypothetical protein
MHESLKEYLRTVLNCPDGVPGAILVMHTFGERINFHPHIHAFVADGLFIYPTPKAASIVGGASESEALRTFSFLPRPKTSSKPLEELFRAKVIDFFVAEKLLSPEQAQDLYSWENSGFSAFADNIVPPEATAQLEGLAQYVLRNPFSVEKMVLDSSADRITYQSKRGTQIFKPTDFLAAIVQHIPNKGTQRIRYYGQYSNKSRGMSLPDNRSELVVCLPSVHQKVPKRKWRELMMSVWHVDPLRCPVCERSMRIVAVIQDPRVIENILRHLNAWHDPPTKLPPDHVYESYTREPCEDVVPMPDYERFPD